MEVEITRKAADVTVKLSADEWQIFSIEGSDYVAEVLSVAASYALSQPTAVDAWIIWNRESQRFLSWGTTDSEPTREFERLVDKVFGADR